MYVDLVTGYSAGRRLNFSVFFRVVSFFSGLEQKSDAGHNKNVMSLSARLAI